MADFWIEPQEFVATDSLAETLLASPLMGSSTLNQAFEASRGFALSFRRDGLGELRRRYPFLASAVERLTASRARRALRTHPFELGKPNAFYLNALLVPPGASVGRHVDATLRAPSEVPGLLPEWVSVLHLRAPESGGELELFRGDRLLAVLEARQGRVLHFRGELLHGVRAVDPGTDCARLSLVCENYCVPRAGLRRLDRIRTHSNAGFHSLVDQGLATS